MTNSDYDRETFERLVRLESSTNVKFVELDKSIALARQGIDYRLAGMNEFQKRMDKLEGTFVTREQLEASYKVFNAQISYLSKLVYIGVGILFTLQVVFHIFLK